MEKKVVKRASKRETTATESAVSPFVEPVVEPERTPRVFKIAKAAKLESQPAAEIKKAPAKRARKAAPIDPFSEIASTSPVKKVAKPRKKAAATTAEPTEIPDPIKLTTTTPTKNTRTAKASTVATAKSKARTKASLDVTAEIAAAEPEVELSPAFKALADVSLPELKKENRAQLLMQSPARAFFYWSVRENPWQQLRGAFGEQGSYALVVKFTNIDNGREEFFAAEPEGDRWFDVEPDTSYQAEIGFYAPNRPYFRIVYSNTIETPRRSPSPHPASDARWTVSANKFAEVLDVSGFTRDAIDVAIAGDDVNAASDATHLAFSGLVGGGDFSNFGAEDLRYAMLSIAAGVDLDELRSRVGGKLFSVLQSNREKLSPETSRAALKEHFDIDEAEWVEEELGSAVHGGKPGAFPKGSQKAKSDFRNV